MTQPRSLLFRTEHLCKLYPDGQVHAVEDVTHQHPPRRVRGHHGPQRQRQVDAAEPARRARPAHLRRGLLRRPAALEAAQTSTGFRVAEVRLRLPVVPPAADPDGGRERAGADVRGAARGPAARAKGRGTAGDWSAWAIAPTTCRRSSRSASGSGWPSPARWPTTRSPCWPTSRPAISTRRRRQVLDLFDHLHHERHDHRHWLRTATTWPPGRTVSIYLRDGRVAEMEGASVLR